MEIIVQHINVLVSYLYELLSRKRGLTKMKFKLLWLTLFVSIISIVNITAQDLTKIVGKVTDANTGEPLPFVDVIFLGTYTGASTDLDGKYVLDSKFPSDTILVTFIGYEPQKIAIAKEVRRQVIDVKLKEESVVAQEVVIKAKRKRYRKKNNPAVALMRKVIANKQENSIESKPFYSYDQHEKITLDLNNITEDLTERKILGKFDFLWEYLDTSKVNGKVFLPIYLTEVLSSVYYTKSPEELKENRKAVRMTKFDDGIDDRNLTKIVDLLYQDVNLNKASIKILDNDFLSPLSPYALNYYRYYITDTLDVNGNDAIRLSFIPRNKTFIGFTGDLFVANDSTYAVLKADLGVTKQISINYLRDIKVVQEFEQFEDVFIKSKDDITLDVSFTKGSIGMFANKSVTYDGFNFKDKPNKNKFKGAERIVTDKDAYDKPDDYWATNRITPLTEKNIELESMIDRLVVTPAYKKFIWWSKFVATGYLPIKNVDLGSIAYFVSANDVEGLRLRLGGETRYKAFSNSTEIEGLVAYGLKDKRWKYKGSILYSFNKDYRLNPRHYIKANYRHDVVFPGLKSVFNHTDHVFTTFGRGTRSKMLFIDSYRLDYVREFDWGGYEFNFERRQTDPYGSLTFDKLIGEDTVSVPNVVSTEVGFALEYSPNATYLQGRKRRTPISSNWPVFKLRYNFGIDGFLGGEYTYHNVSLNMTKRFSMSIVGRSEFEIEFGGVFGKDLPYILLYIPDGNQSYSFSQLSFNMMDFLEFSADKYVKIYNQHFFDGFIFNRIPLWRKLKLKEVFTFKMIYGAMSDDNNPELNPDKIQFPVNAEGVPTTYTFDDRIPYIEYGFGVYNIFKLIRIDMIKRVNYLDKPTVSSFLGKKGWGIRGSVKVEF